MGVAGRIDVGDVGSMEAKPTNRTRGGRAMSSSCRLIAVLLDSRASSYQDNYKR